MRSYRTVSGPGRAEQEIQRSRFIAYVQPVHCREEADAFLAEIRRRHRDATHCVPAVVLGDRFQVQWCSDDGEPQGTSGAPMLQMLVQEGVTDVCVVVVRYFGGIKLGTGGLVRAYTGSAKLGLAAAGICEVRERRVLTCRADYSSFHKIQTHSFSVAVTLTPETYADAVTFRAAVEFSDAAQLTEELQGLCGGALTVLAETTEPVRVPVQGAGSDAASRPASEKIDSL